MKTLQILEEQLDYSKEQNKSLTKQMEVLTEQIRQLTKALYGSKSEKFKYQSLDGQGSLFKDDPSFCEPEQTEEQSMETVSYTVVRKKRIKIGTIRFVMIWMWKKFTIILPTSLVSVVVVR
ncbi:transposase [Massilibacterium senegalense]|uniref:transposase n=1 Tax=Massilibacterium senegalense TaxID=1632858 RepID=UPI001E554120|nr:transposase [Massilibacterium senegalense]